MTSLPSATTDLKPLLRVDDLRMHFKHGVALRRPRVIRAVDGVSLAVAAGETLGLVGESGSGKSTLGRAILRLYRPTSGRVDFRGVCLTEIEGEELRRSRRHMQMVFQDPSSSLNPRMTIGATLSEPLAIHHPGADHKRRVREMLQLVGLNPDAVDRHPHEFSGGQLQRVGIARAMMVEPSLIVCDEPISALDVSIQAQIINLLRDLQARFGLAYLFIAHDLSVVRHISHRVAVMYAGLLIEVAETDQLYDKPMHPYTVALLSAVPILRGADSTRAKKRIVLTGEVPDPANPPSGCRFHPRCWLWRRLGMPEKCTSTAPSLRRLDLGHQAACHFAEEVASRSSIQEVAPR